MAIPWKPIQRQVVDAVLQQHPADSGQCDDAAKKILPLAQECDENARILRIRPKLRARYVVPRIKLARPWFEHQTTEALLHYVDALTGSDGTAASDYLLKYWEHPAFLDVQPL
jgi:hypothetical protein